MLSLSLCAGMFVENPVQERFLKVRYYLSVLGLPQLVYWFSNILFDSLIYLMQASLMIYLVIPLKLEAYSFYFSDYVCLILAFGLAHITFSYFISFWFKNPQSALKAFSLIYLFGGFFLPFLLKNIVFAV